MTDRYNFLEIGDEKPRVPTPPPEAEANGAGFGWRERRLRPVETIGEVGTGAGQCSAPTGLAVDPWGALYIADSNNHRIQRITPGGDVYVIGRAGHTTEQFWGPQAIAVSPSGEHFFVAEQGNDRVQGFHFSGQRGAQHLVMYTGFKSPSGVAYDAQGMLWVADTGNARVLRIDTRTGQCIGGFGQNAGLARPISVVCDAFHNLYVTDGAANDVIRFTYTGVRTFALGDMRRLADPRQVAVDAQGCLYLAESGADRLHVFDPQGYSLATFDKISTRLGAMRAPSGVALGPNGEIYVSDTLDHRVLRLAWE